MCRAKRALPTRLALSRTSLEASYQHFHPGIGYFLSNPPLCISVDMYDKFDFV